MYEKIITFGESSNEAKEVPSDYFTCKSLYESSRVMILFLCSSFTIIIIMTIDILILDTCECIYRTYKILYTNDIVYT